MSRWQSGEYTRSKLSLSHKNAAKDPVEVEFIAGEARAETEGLAKKKSGAENSDLLKSSRQKGAKKKQGKPTLEQKPRHTPKNEIRSIHVELFSLA
jgi:hypothetical protein